MQQVTIYREANRYVGWPANYGMWGWGNEIVLGFTAGQLKAGVPFHARDKDQPFETIQARSLNGGESWEILPFPGRTPGGRGLSADEHMNPHLWLANALEDEGAPTDCPGGINFTHPDFALMCARTNLRAGAKSWFYVSYDRCQSWEGPYWLPMFGQTGIAARTDYLVDGPESCTLFLTAAKPDGQEGRVFCARTTDGGKSFDFVSWITPEPEGYTIMPASLRLPSGRILTAVRCSEAMNTTTSRHCWIDLYASDNNGLSWQHLSRPVPDAGKGGNPPTLTRLLDGRLCLTYGFRNPPFAIQATLNADEGVTWGEPITLHHNAGNHDLGYPRTYLRPDGTMVTAYYFNEDEDLERYIAATLWKP
jgi:hypothetical protein